MPTTRHPARPTSRRCALAGQGPLALPAALAALLAAAPGAARAADDPARRAFDADPHRMALSLDGGFAAETAAAEAAGTWRAGALLELADGLLVLRQGGRTEDLIGPRLALHLLGGWSLGRVELGVELPVAVWQRADLALLTSQGVTGPLVTPIARTALGDLRLAAKVPLLDAAAWPIGLAAMAELRLPTGDPKAFTSDGLALVPSVVASRPLGRLRLDAQLGYQLRRTGQYAQLSVADGWVGVLGAGYDLPPVGALTRWRALAELTGGLPRTFDAGTDRTRAPLSARAGLRAWLSEALSVELGGGAGLGETGYGHERWRVFLGVRAGGRYAPGPPPPLASTPPGAPAPADRDRDGVPDATDRCPDLPGPAALDGCPDRDGDEIPDLEDECPDEPGKPAHAGCPAPQVEPVVEVGTERLSISDAITFDTARDTLKPESFPVLDQIARVLIAHPELTQVRVEGHTDNVGAADYNKDLSQRRAAAVVRYLVGKGVEGARLVPAGYGFERPVATNATVLGRARNRRVEFTLLGGASRGR